MSGLKHDQGKLRWDLLPLDSIEEVVKVYTFGAGKYDDENWREGISWKRIIGAIFRHLAAFCRGQDVDDESGLDHRAHAVWGLLTLMNYTRTHPDMDDRVKI